jgi:hypothetical protein
LITPVVDRLSPQRPEFTPKLKYTCGVAVEGVADMMAEAMAALDPAAGITQILLILIPAQQLKWLWVVAVVPVQAALDQAAEPEAMAVILYWSMVVAHMGQGTH